MVLNKRLFLIGIVILLSILACTVGAKPQADSDAVATQVAQTVEAGSMSTLTAAAANNQAPPAQSDNEANEPQPVEAMATDTPTATIPNAPTATAVPVVSVSVNTNCRYGPGEVYKPPIGALLTGEEALVVGLPSSPIDYIVIENPDGPDVCWLWTKYATITGDTAGLPKYQIPSTPTPVPTDTPTPAGPVFTIKYKNVHVCGGLKYATVRIENTGSEIFRSAQIYVRDKDAAVDLYGPASSNSPFMDNHNDCPPGNGSVEPGNGAYIAVSIGAAPPSGHKARFQLTLCTENNLGGDCEIRTVDFEIP